MSDVNYPHEDPEHEWSAPPDDATCPGCHVPLTAENIAHKPSGTAGAMEETDVPGVEREVEVPICTLCCVTCLVENRKW